MQLFEYDFKAMGSPCLVQCYSLDPAMAEKIFALVQTEVERLEQKYSRYRPDSLLSRINQAAGSNNAITIDLETHAILNYVQQAFELSDGLFDVTSGVLRQAWDFESGTLPETEQANRALIG